MQGLGKQETKLEDVSKADAIRLQIFLKNCVNEYSYTPDWVELEQSEYVPVFLYCNLMRGGSLHHCIEDVFKAKSVDGLSVNPYVFSHRRYEMWQTKDGRDSYPIALPSRLTTPKLSVASGTITSYPMKGYVKGRVYFIPSAHMKDLDRLKQNGVLFNRIKIGVKLPYRIQNVDESGLSLGKEEFETMDVWMYIGRREYWDDVPLINLQRCSGVRYTYRKHGSHMVIHDTKPYLNGDDIFYYFNAWEINNK